MGLPNGGVLISSGCEEREDRQGLGQTGVVDINFIHQLFTMWTGSAQLEWGEAPAAGAYGAGTVGTVLNERGGGRR
jgi:hypothetical protein